MSVRREHPSGYDFPQRTGRFSVPERNEANRVTDSFRTIYRTVQSDERSRLVFGRELFAGIKENVQRCDMRAQQNVGGNGGLDQFVDLRYLSESLRMFQQIFE